MSSIDINGHQIYNCFISGFKNIKDDREEINSINVFPVADGDTGNNLVRTIKLIVAKLEPKKSASEVLDNIASLSLDSARGNSGLIFSQFLNGLAIFTQGKEALTLNDFSKAANGAAKMAYEAVEEPVEGTILTILRVWAKAIEDFSVDVEDIEPVFSKALIKAKGALENTKNQLEILKENDVIDAGAFGFVSFLEGIDKLSKKTPLSIGLLRNTDDKILNDGATHIHSLKGSKVEFRYCTEVLLESFGNSKDIIKEKVSSLGDSMVVTQGVNKLRLHIHTNKPNRVVEILKSEGRILEQKADEMFRQEQILSRRLSNIAVLTDSIADIPRDLLDQYQIHVINNKLLWGDEEYLDRITITPKEFYKYQKTRKDFPGSSLPSEGEVRTVYNYLLEYYDGIIVLPVGKLLSGTWNVMNKVAEKIDPKREKIKVIDTCLNSAAQGLLVSEVGKKSLTNKTLDELVTYSESLKKRIRIYVSVDTFKYMVKGGRVSPLKGLVAKILNLKPIVSLDESGKSLLIGKAFSRESLLKKINALISSRNKDNSILSYAIVHADDLETASKFSSIMTDSLCKTPEYISEISTIVGTHSGRGAIAIATIESELT